MRTLRVKRLILCLLVGSIVTVATSWLISAAYARRVLGGWGIVSEQVNAPGQVIRELPTGMPLPGSYPRATWTSRSESFGRVTLRAMGSQGWTPGQVMGEGYPEAPQRAWAGEQVRLGWPMAALERRSWDAYVIPGESDAPLDELASPLGAIDLGLASGRADHGYPLIPVWPGFVVNVLAYGAICWMLLTAPGVAVRWRRKRRGLCRGCGYDMTGVETCPECGA